MGLIRRKNSSCKTKSLFLKQMQATSLEKNCPRAVCTGLQQIVRIKFGPNTDAHRTQFQKGHKLLSFNTQAELAAKTAWVSLQSLNIPDLINCHKTYHFSTQLHIFHYWKCFLRIPVCSIQDFFLQVSTGKTKGLPSTRQVSSAAPIRCSSNLRPTLCCPLQGFFSTQKWTVSP